MALALLLVTLLRYATSCHGRSSKPKEQDEETMSRTFKYNILVDTLHVFDGFIVSSAVVREDLIPRICHAPNLASHLPTWNLSSSSLSSLSMLVFSFLLAAEKKNGWKWAQSAPKSPSCLTISHTCHLARTHFPSLSLCGPSGCLFYGRALEWLFITL